jgi:hypothetical protein
LDCLEFWDCLDCLDIWEFWDWWEICDLPDRTLPYLLDIKSIELGGLWGNSIYLVLNDYSKATAISGIYSTRDLNK